MFDISDKITISTELVNKAYLLENPIGVMCPHVITSLEKTFNYYASFGEYAKRYSDYCQRIDILEEKDNQVITNEIWNMTVNMEFDHVVITVKYVLVPYREIKYEVIKGYGTGHIKGSITFERCTDGSTQVQGNLVALEVFAGLTKNPNDSLVQHMDSYFTWKDMRLLEGKPTPNLSGDPCPLCKDGILGYSHKKQEGDIDEPRLYQTKFFICNKCGQTIENFFVHANETRRRF